MNELLQNFPVKQQRNGHDCGVCVTWCIFKYFGYNFSYKEIYDLFDPPKEVDEGISGEEILKILRKSGIKVKSEKSNLSNLKFYTSLNHPVIVSIQHRKKYNEPWHKTIEYGHYVVVLYVDNKIVKFMDPNYGKIRILSVKEFKKRWHDGDEKNIYKYPALICYSEN